MLPGYIVVSPVRNEAPYIRRTLESVAHQDCRPLQWIIVDDGSSDGTPSVVKAFAEQHGFIRLIDGGHSNEREHGTRIITAFNRGYSDVRSMHHEFVVKLDCDLSFDPSYFSTLLARFMQTPRLGIASGVYLEPSSPENWKPVKMPSYHAAGASKMLRRECYEQIGGFAPARGWDTVDEIRAMTKGWLTTHFTDLKMRHWKVEGSRIGRLRTSVMHGEVYYRTRGGGLFFAMKVAHRAATRPWLIAGGALAFGYLRAMFRHESALVNDTEARCYRELLNTRLRQRLRFPRLDPA